MRLLYQQYDPAKNSTRQLTLSETGEARLTENGVLLGRRQLSGAEAAQLFAELQVFCELPAPNYVIGSSRDFEHRIGLGGDCPRTLIIRGSATGSAVPEGVRFALELLTQIMRDLGSN